jgi:pyruvate/2-oxoglutarate dehydrogenase complex dihydrolipoamide acyltransferase (E2) component
MLYVVTLKESINTTSELRVLEWHVAEGSECKQGQLLVELESFKAVIEIYASQAAFLRRILVPAGKSQGLGKVIAILSDSPLEDVPVDLSSLGEMAVEYAFM